MSEGEWKLGPCTICGDDNICWPKDDTDPIVCEECVGQERERWKLSYNAMQQRHEKLRQAALAFIEKFDRMEFAREEMMRLKVLVDPDRWKP